MGGHWWRQACSERERLKESENKSVCKREEKWKEMIVVTEEENKVKPGHTLTPI